MILKIMITASSVVYMEEPPSNDVVSFAIIHKLSKDTMLNHATN